MFRFARSPAFWIVTAAFAPATAAYFFRLWSLEHYQFFPFALLGAAALAKRAADGSARDREPVQRKPSRFVSASGAIVAFGLLAVSIVLDSPWAGYAGALVMLANRLYAVGGSAGLARFLPALAMLVILLRPPLNLDVALITGLQRVTTRVSSIALDVLNVVHVRSGNVIEIPGRRLFVEEACSGVNSLFSAAACLIFYLMWTHRHGFVWTVLLGSLPVWVIAANAARITAVAWLRDRWNIAADEGWRHDLLGLIVFAAVLLLLFGTERLLRFYAAVIPPAEEMPESDGDPSTAIREPAQAPRSKSRYAVVVTACCLLALQIPMLTRDVGERASAAWNVRIDDLGEGFLPATIGDWKRSGFRAIKRNRGSAFGEYSQLWSYASGGKRGTSSFDYPFVGWHELSECYESQGWTVESRTVIDVGPSNLPCVAVRLVHPQSARHALLWFTLLTRDGKIYQVRKAGEWDEFFDRVAVRMRDVFSRPSPEADAESLTYQAQLFVESYAPLNDADRAEGERLFAEFVALLQQRRPQLGR